MCLISTQHAGYLLIEGLLHEREDRTHLIGIDARIQDRSYSICCDAMGVCRGEELVVKSLMRGGYRIVKNLLDEGVYLSGCGWVFR